MKKWLKVLLIIICVAVFAGGSIIGVIKLSEYTETTRKEKQEKMEQDKIHLAYWELNYSFGMAAYKTDYELEKRGVYVSLTPPPSEEFNKFGIHYYPYLVLKMYEARTGKILSYENVIDYLSQEYEPDGSLRLYNNGLHPEIEAYVEYMQGRHYEMDKYVNDIDKLYGQYWYANKDKGFKSQVFYGLSPQMYDELAKKEADPSYEMDLLSLQQQGY